MPKYMICVCGWVSEEYPDNWKPFGVGGVLDCPDCRVHLRNATLEMCYGHVSVVTSNELKELREQEAHGIMWEQAFRNLQRKRVKETLDDTWEKIRDLAIEKEECKHYDREEINEIMDGKTKPVVYCKDCGRIIEEMPQIKAARDEWAEMTEDKLRKMKRKSIRIQGKYKGRGKEKRREP